MFIFRWLQAQSSKTKIIVKYGSKIIFQKSTTDRINFEKVSIKDLNKISQSLLSITVQHSLHAHIVSLKIVGYETCVNSDAIKDQSIQFENLIFKNCLSNCITIISTYSWEKQFFKFKNLNFSLLNNYKNYFFQLISNNPDILLQNIHIENSITKGIFINPIFFGNSSKNNRIIINVFENFVRNLTGQFLFIKNSYNQFLSSIKFTRNIIENCKSFSSLIQLYDCDCLINENTFFNNSLNDNLLIIHSDMKNSLNIQNNTFYSNGIIGLSDRTKAIIYISAYNIKINRNIFYDYLSSIEITLFRLKTDVQLSDCSLNFWNAKKLDPSNRVWDGKIIGSKYAELELEPILYSFKDLGVSFSCGLNGWKEFKSSCYFFHYSSLSYKEAKYFCSSKFSDLISEDELSQEKLIRRYFPSLDYVQQNSHNLSVWFAVNEFKYNNTNRYEKIKPFICKRKSSICRKNCNYQGICSKRTCVCIGGWTGEDCSKFTCKNVNDCSNNGKCVGPNTCKCNPGYHGSTCSASFCSRYLSCNHCTNKAGCGWCDEKKSVFQELDLTRQ